jgi:hypothetical protein
MTLTGKIKYPYKYITVLSFSISNPIMLCHGKEPGPPW